MNPTIPGLLSSINTLDDEGLATLLEAMAADWRHEDIAAPLTDIAGSLRPTPCGMCGDAGRLYSNNGPAPHVSNCPDCGGL